MQRRIISIMIIVLVLAVYSFLNSGLFLFEGFDWEGIVHVDTGTLLDRTSFIDTNVFRIDKSIIVEIVKENIWIDSVNISWKWPNRFLIKVTERQPIAAVIDKDIWFLLDEQGVLLPLLASISIHDYPIITNLDIDDNELFRNIARVLATMPMDLYDYISEWNAEDQLLITREGTQVLLGDLRDLNAKFTALKSILDDLSARNKVAKRIDLRILNSPVVIE